MYRDHMQIGLRPKKQVFFSLDIGTSTDSEKKALLNSVLKSDDPNGVPKNDLGVFMSSETSPEVRDFMKNYLLNDSSGMSADDAKISANDIAKLTDDDITSILDSMPKRGETLNEYEARIEKYLSDEKSRRQKAFNDMKRKKDLEEVFERGKSSN